VFQINHRHKYLVRFDQIEKPVVADSEAVIWRKLAFQFFDVRAEIRISSELRIDNAFDFFAYSSGAMLSFRFVKPFVSAI
jgi:hypothetical protein